MSLEHYGINVNGYAVRSEMHQGRPHIVVPAVMLRQGVMAGSHGPLLHLIEDYGRFVGAWNGIPVTINHPQEDGMPVSANSPDVIDNQVVGRVYNAFIDGDKLKAEVWIDEGALNQISPEALDMIRCAKPMDVSVGVFTDDESVSGDWNGTEYQAIARNHRPDHLSLLPGGVGACSFSAGCGIRANQKGGEDVKDKSRMIQTDEILHLDDIKAFLRGGYSVNEMGFREISQQIQTKLDRMDDDQKIHFLEECFDNYFIYRVQTRGGSRDGQSLYRRGYQTAADDSIEFTGEAQPVVKKVDYVTANQEKEVIVMTEKKCCPEKVKALIADPKTKWAEADEPMLLTMSAEQLEKLAPVVEVKTEKVEVPALMTQEQAIQVLQAHLGDPDKALALFPKETREMLADGLNLHRERRAALIDRIVTNQATPIFTKEKLEARSMADLNELAQAISPKTDFTPLGGGTPAPAGYSDEALLPPGVE